MGAGVEELIGEAGGGGGDVLKGDRQRVLPQGAVKFRGGREVAEAPVKIHASIPGIPERAGMDAERKVARLMHF